MNRSICLIHHAGIQGYPYLMDTAKLLAHEGWEVGVLALRDAPLPEYDFRDKNIQTYRFPLNIEGGSLKQKIKRVTSYIFWAARTARKRRYSVYMGFDQNGLFAASLASLRLRGAPVIYYSPELHFSGDLTSVTDRLKKSLERLFSRRSEAVITQDRRRADVLIKDNGLKVDRVYIVPNAPLAAQGYSGRKDYLSRLLSQCGIGNDRIIVLLMGTLADWTMAKEIVRSVEGWPPECVLVVHGWGEKGYVEELRRLAGEQNPRRVLISTNVLDYDDMEGLTAAADIGLALYRGGTTNIYEMGSSGKLYGYMKAGIPVITSDFPGLREVVEKNKAGICIDSTRRENIVKAVTQLAEDFALRRRYGENARKAFLEKYAYERNFGPILSLLDSLSSN